MPKKKSKKKAKKKRDAAPALTPDGQVALRTLHDAAKFCAEFVPKVLGESQQEAIGSIIQGGHLTFRYILMTALLAKVVEPRIHMRSLQAGAKLRGAYDARSLCHKVWVPFEREHLDSRLGGSNEPFLNKPARFAAVDKSNAVRAGADRELLRQLYDLLESLNASTPSHHREAFLLAMSATMQRSGRTPPRLGLSTITVTSDSLRHFLDAYLRSSFGGETCVSVVGAILSARLKSADYDVVVHPANQPGASSNEVGDIDVYLGDAVELPVEVKDKSFKAPEVDHAIHKARSAGCPRLLFVLGRQATGEDAELAGLVAAQASQGFDLAFTTVDAMMASEAALLGEIERRSLIQKIGDCLAAMRTKDETRRHFMATLEGAGFTS